jgi:hypothetical protein
MELKTSVFYKAGGTTYTFPFEYLQKNFVKVRYQKPDASYVNLEYEKDYTITEDTVNLMVAGSTDDIINIYRETPADRLVKYVDASILKAHDMNVNELQTLHIMEEQTDYLTAYALFKADNANRWDARQLRLTNVALPQEPTDAVNKAYVDEYGVKWDQNVAQMKKQLEDQDAKINKQMDDKDAAWAKQLKDQSDSFDALISKHDADQRAEVDAQVEQAKKWAESAESPDGTEGAKSAKTWAGEAKTSRQGALDSENKAKISATEANVAATKAKASQVASASSEANAKESEVNAKASEIAAAESANYVAQGQINADWNETNANSKAYIKNKPDIPTFVDKSLAELVDSAPESLDTLNELAKALGNDPNFATTVINELAKKLNSTEAESTYATKTEAGVPYQIKRNTAYKVGDVLTSPSLPPGCVIVVTQAGTTGSTEPDWTTIKSNMGVGNN